MYIHELTDSIVGQVAIERWTDGWMDEWIERGIYIYRSTFIVSYMTYSHTSA